MGFWNQLVLCNESKVSYTRKQRSLNLMELELTTDQLQVRLPTRCVVLYFKRMLVQHEFYFDPCN